MGKESLLKIAFKHEEIEIGGEKYQIRELSSGEASKYQASVVKVVNGRPQYDLKNSMRDLIMLSLCDEKGDRVFSDEDAGMIDMLPSSVSEQIFKTAQKVNGMDAESAEKN